MKKRYNSAPWAPDEASPCLDESSRRAESEFEEHFVRKTHFSVHFSINKCYFSIKQQIAKLGRNHVSAQYLGSAWRQDQDAGFKIQEFWPKKKQIFGTECTLISVFNRSTVACSALRRNVHFFATTPKTSATVFMFHVPLNGWLHV